MTFSLVSGPVHPVRPAFVRVVATSIIALFLSSGAFAQQPPAPAPTPQPKPAPRPAPKAQPKQQPAPQAQPVPAQPQQQAGGDQQMPVIYSPWTKFCGKDQQAGAKETCLTVKEARLETGQFLAGAALIEQEGEIRKIFRITLPLGMQLPQGTRIVIDQDQPLSGRYIVCLPNGCMADFEVNAEFVGRLKKSQQVTLQGINLPGQAASYPLPLGDFAKANEGPATDPKKFEEDQRKLQEELQRRAEEARKRLERNGQPGTPAPTR
jgi:invasion protein IalB